MDRQFPMVINEEWRRQEARSCLKKYGWPYEIKEDGTFMVTLPEQYRWDDDSSGLPDVVGPDGIPVGCRDLLDDDFFFY